MSGGAGLEAVTFDYWNTLCYEPELFQLDRVRADVVTKLLEADGVADARRRVELAVKAVRERYLDAWQANVQYTAEHAVADLADSLEAPAGSPLRDAIAAEFDAVGAGAELLLVDGVRDALDELKDRGVKLGIVCDVGLLSSPWLRHHLDGHGLLDRFDHWSFSDEVGVYKPARAIFEHALEGLGGVAPERAAHVGDRRGTDVAGALGMGMRAVRLTTVYDDPAEGPSGDAVIASYAELLPALGL